MHHSLALVLRKTQWDSFSRSIDVSQFEFFWKQLRRIECIQPKALSVGVPIRALVYRHPRINKGETKGFPSKENESRISMIVDLGPKTVMSDSDDFPVALPFQSSC